MAATTIKIDPELRDRINDAARERGLTAGSFVESLFEGWLREQRFAAIREAVGRTSVDLVDSWYAESAEYEATLADGPTEPVPHR
jgi:predicted transcriptional regulator